MDVWHEVYLLVYSWVMAWVQYFRAPGINGEAEGDQQLIQLLLGSIRCWKMLLFQVAEGTAVAGPSPSWVEQGKLCCKDQRAAGWCRGCFPNRDRFVQDTSGSKRREQDRCVPRPGDRGIQLWHLVFQLWRDWFSYRDQMRAKGPWFGQLCIFTRCIGSRLGQF